MRPGTLKDIDTETVAEALVTLFTGVGIRECHGNGDSGNTTVWGQMSGNTVVTVNTVRNYGSNGHEKCESYRSNGETRELNGSSVNDQCTRG